MIDNNLYFAGDNQTAYQEHNFFLLASWSKQDDFQYHTGCSSWRDFMLYLLPLQTNGEMVLEVLFLWSIGIM